MMAASRNRFRYFALPAEIRNQIMEYVLIPGDVYIRPAKRTSHTQQPKKSPFSRLKRGVNAIVSLSRHLSGQFQRLVTDDVRLKGQFTIHYMFYAMNTFHWPPGPVSNSDDWYANLQPEHRKMIKTICIDLDLVDLMCVGMDAVEYSAGRRPGGRPNDYDGNAWSYEAMHQLALRLWTQIVGLYCCATPQNLRGFVGLEKVIVQSSIGRCVLSSRLGSDENEWESLTELVTAVCRRFETIIQLQVYIRGWKKTNKWLEGLRRTRFRA